MPQPPTIEPWPEGLAHDLDDPRAFPDSGRAGAGSVEVRQTHLSRVYLVGERVYKLPRAVDVGFVSFALREERALECRREVELNRRLAPDVYLGVAPIARDGDHYRVGSTIAAPGELPEDVEHCIVMRRLDDDRNALSLLRRGELGIDRIRRLAHRLARFHRAESLGCPAPFSPSIWEARNADPVRANFEALDRAAETVLGATAVSDLREATEAALVSHRERFERRRVAGCAVDGHGDLHLEHVWFETDDSEPIAIDGLVFREDLRRIDRASEMAFLAMDLCYRGRTDLSEHLLAHYAAALDDFDLYSVVDLFESYRAAVRAKVAALAALDPAIDPEQRRASAASARRHVAAASLHLERPGAGPLVLVAGHVGSGKSTLARRLAADAGIAILASDVIRPHVVGEDDGREDSPGLRYGDAARNLVYAAMRERARAVLASGRPAILDATFAKRAQRDAAIDLAHQMGAECWIIEARCSRDVALDRLSRRAARGDDASQAGPAQLDASLEEFDSIGVRRGVHHVLVETDSADTESICRDLSDQWSRRRTTQRR